ncbi:MAG: hypothetical protein M1831_001697 [Alyxoria varia]|nr:MAG: hypothetical protein M1831_001697 [Alyxoria varia]
MTSPIKNVILAGAGGNTGQATLPALLNAGFNVSVLTRSSSNAAFPESVTVHATDYSEASLSEAFKGQDAVVSMVGSFEPKVLTDVQVKMVDVAVKAGVRWFIPSEYGMDTSPEKGEELCPPLKLKRAVSGHLKSLESSGMGWTGIIVGAFFDWALENGFMGWNIPDRKVTIFDTGDQPLCLTNLDLIAQTVVAVLQQPEKARNTFVYVNSAFTSQNKILAELEKQLGQNFETDHARTQDLAAEGRKRWADGELFAGAYNVILAALNGGWGLNEFEEKSKNWMQILGLEEEALETTIERVIAKCK